MQNANTTSRFHPGRDYLISDALRMAFQGALDLGQPLLLTGEPGTGKTTLADWAIYELNERRGGGFHPQVLRFNTKTTSTARDLFYTYDALSHFQAANLKGGEPRATADFIELQALGQAIAMSNPQPEYERLFRTTQLPRQPLSAVVLIDEIDKAPRDFTNDILDEIDKYRFTLREQDNVLIEKGPDARIVVIMTSNSEKNLPDAFLRRCAFFHIEFPRSQDLRRIVELHLGPPGPAAAAAYDELLAYFEQVRAAAVRKKPATAELIGWLRLLGLRGYFEEKAPEARRQLLEYNLSFLVKTQEDLEAVRRLAR